MCRFVPALVLAAALPLQAAGWEEPTPSEPFRLDEVLRRNDGRHNTLGPTGKRLFAERIEQAPGFRGLFSYLRATPGFREPLALSFRDEKGALPARHMQTIWRPSHLEVRWRLEGREPAGEETGAGIDVIERKFITDDDTLVDRVRVVNAAGRPVSIEAVAAGAMTPLPERFRSRQILCDLSSAAGLVPCPGRRLFTCLPEQESVWTEGEAPFFQSGSAGSDLMDSASGGACLGRGFGGEKGHRALYVTVCPEAGGKTLGLCIRYARDHTESARFAIEIDGQKRATVDFAPTGGWGDEPSHWRFARSRPGGLAPGLRKIALVSEADGGRVNVDGFFVLPAADGPPPLPDSGRYPAGTEEQIAYLPGSVDYDGVRYLLPDPDGGGNGDADGGEASRPTLVALRGGIDGDRAFDFPEETLVEVPAGERAVSEFHLLALVAGPRGFDPGAAAAFTFVFENGSTETVPFPDVTERIAADEGDRVTGAGHAAAGHPGFEGRALWRFLVLPLIDHPCVQLSYTPPPGRFVHAIRFGKETLPIEGAAAPAAVRRDIPVLMAVTRETPPPSGRLPAYLGRETFHGFPVSLALAGSEFAAVRSAEYGRVLVRSLQLEPGEAADFTLVVATDRRDDRAASAAIEKTENASILADHIAVYRKWFDDHAPLFDCSDPVLETVWHYRWFLARHCMIRPEAPPLTAPVFYEGMHGGRSQAVTTFAAPHILAEVRWLRDKRFAAGQLRAFLRTMDRDGLFEDVRVGVTGGGAVNHWIPAAAIDAYRVNGDRQFLMEVLYLLARNVDGTLAAFDRDGDGLPAPRNGIDPDMKRYPSVYFFSGFDGGWPDGRFERPDYASYIFASCAALAEGFALVGDREREERYARLAEKVRSAALDTFWDGEDGFFYAAREDDGIRARCREVAGFYPFAMGLCPVRAPYTRAFDDLVDSDEFWTPFPPATCARSVPVFSAAVGEQPGAEGMAADRMWNGPTWPHAQTVAAEAMARALRSGAETAVTPALFEEFLRRYALLHLENGDPGRPLIRECCDGETGEGWGCADAFQSAFNDLLIRYVGGVVPGARDLLELHPVFQGLDRFRFRRLLYHGHELEIVWVRPGTPNPYEGRGDGFAVLVDGKVAAAQTELKRVTIKL